MVLASTTVRHTGTMATDLLSASIQISTDTAAVGDTLVAVLFVADLSVASGDAAQGVTAPAGWTIRNVASMVPTGDPRRMSGVFIVAEKKVTVAGTDTGVFKWSCVQWRPMKLYKTWCQLTDGALIGTHMQHTASLTVIRFTGVTGILSIIESRLANQLVTYPGQQLPYTASGHAITIGGIKQAKGSGTLLPALYHTQRALFGPLRYGGLDIPQTGVSTISIATRDFAGTTELSDFSGTAVGDGYAVSILVATVVKPRVSWVSPVPGVVDLSKPIPVSWTPPDAGAQSHYALYRESPPGSGSNIQWWNGSAWVASGVWNATSSTQATLAGFSATSGAQYRFLLKTHTTIAADDSDYAVLDLTHRPTPAAPSITLSPAPVAGVLGSRVPTMTVSGETVTDGGTVQARELQWVDGTGKVLASATVSPWVPNLCSNAGMETDISGWAARGTATLSRSLASSHGGVASLQVVATSSNQGADWRPPAGTATGAFSVSAWVLAPAGTPMRILAYSLGAGYVDKETTFTGTGAWQYVKAEGGTIGATGNPYIAVEALSAATFLVDDVAIGNAPTASVLTTPLDNGAAVKARARFQQGGGMWSDWAELPVTITVPKPAAPATVFATVTHPVSGLPLPQLTVTAAAGLTVRVERGGAVIGEVVSPGPTVSIVDLAAPSGPVTWTVTTLSSTPYAERSQPTNVTGTVTSQGGWLFDPTRPETAVLPRVRELGDVSRDLRASVFDPIGETYSVVQPGVPGAGRGSLTLYHGDPGVIHRTRVLLESGAPLILRGWAEKGRVASWHPDLTFAPVGESNTSRLTQGPFGYRILTVGYVTAPPILAGLGTIT